MEVSRALRNWDTPTPLTQIAIAAQNRRPDGAWGTTNPFDEYGIKLRQDLPSNDHLRPIRNFKIGHFLLTV